MAPDESGLVDRTFQDDLDGVAARVTVSATESIQEELETGDIPASLLFAATYSESLLGMMLQRFFELDPRTFDELFGYRGLGWLLSMCNKYDLVDEEYREPLEKLKNRRNNLAHNFGYINKLKDDPDEREKVREIILDCCEWFESI